MSFEEKIHDIAKREGVVVIAKIMVADNRSYGISESELVDLISNHERRDGESPAQCFARHYEAPNEVGLSLRKAIAIAKNMPFEDDSEAEAEKDSRAAIDELGRTREAALAWLNFRTKVCESLRDESCACKTRAPPSRSFNELSSPDKQGDVSRAARHQRRHGFISRCRRRRAACVPGADEAGRAAAARGRDRGGVFRASVSRSGEQDLGATSARTACACGIIAAAAAAVLSFAALLGR